MDANSITLGGVSISDFSAKTDTFGIFRMKSTLNRKKDNPLFIDIKVSGRMFSPCSQFIKKGTQVLVLGNLEQRTYDKKDGSRGFDISINALSVDFQNKKSFDQEDSVSNSETCVPTEEF